MPLPFGAASDETAAVGLVLVRPEMENKEEKNVDRDRKSVV